MSFEDAGFDTTGSKNRGTLASGRIGWPCAAPFGTSFQAPSVRQKSTSLESAFIQDSARINAVTGALECVPRNVTNTQRRQHSTVVRVVGSEDAEAPASRRQATRSG